MSGRRAWDHAARSAWLSRQAVYDAGPYEQAARVFRQHGYTSAAESILIAQRDQARRLIGGRGAAVRRALDGVFGLTVAYGFRPRRVLWLLAALLVLVLASLELPAAQATLRATSSAGVVYTTRGALPVSGLPVRGSAPTAAHLDVCGDGQVRCFSPVLYTIDTVVPLVSLDRRSTWYPDPHTRAARHGMVAERRDPAGLDAVDDLRLHPGPGPGPAGPYRPDPPLPAQNRWPRGIALMTHRAHEQSTVQRVTAAVCLVRGLEGLARA